VLDCGGDKLTTADFVVVILWFQDFQVCDEFLRLLGLLCHNVICFRFFFKKSSFDFNFVIILCF
jgi:predicted glycosyltransferase